MGDKSSVVEDQKPDDAHYKCPYCQRHFGTMDDLTLHVVTRHSSQRGLPDEVAKQVKRIREAEKDNES